MSQIVLNPFNKLTVPFLSGLSGRLPELKNKAKVQLGNTKSCRSHL